MKRALLAVAVLAPMFAAVYACSTDTFTGGDGAAEGGPQSDFCNEEAIYVHQCYGDAACLQADLNNCGATFGALAPGFAAALTHCMQINQLPCTSDISKIISSSCMSGAMQGYTNDSGALAALAEDYCARCDKGNGGCVDDFASDPSKPGFAASLYADPIIAKIDTCEKTLDGGVVFVGEAGLDCRTQSLVCAFAVANGSLPASACNDR